MLPRPILVFIAVLNTAGICNANASNQEEYTHILAQYSRDPAAYFDTSAHLLNTNISDSGINENSFNDYLSILADLSAHNKYPNITIANEVLVIQSEALIKLLDFWVLHKKLQTQSTANQLESSFLLISKELSSYKMEDYKNRETFVPVPIGGFSGMNPDLIPDLQKRAEYKKALAESYDSSVENNLQMMIRRFQKKIDASYSSFQAQKSRLGLISH